MTTPPPPDPPSPEEGAFRDAQAIRLERLKAILAEGETNPARVIARLDAECLQSGPNGRARMAVGRMTPPPEALDFGNPALFPACPRMPTGVPSYAYTSLSRTRTLRPYYGDFDDLPVEMVLEAIGNDGVDAVVEVGADFGQRLMSLYLRGAPRSIPYFAAEMSPDGLAGCGLLRPLAPEMDFRPVAFDLTAPDLSFLAGLRRVLVFSFGALTTATRLPPGLFRTLAGAAPHVKGYHFEAVGQQIDRGDPLLAWYYARADRQGFNLDFVPSMVDAHRNGVIHAEFLAADVYDLSIGYPISIAIWASAPPSAPAR